MRFQRKHKLKSGIPVAAMPDVVFQLLLFFMVSSIFRGASGLDVQLPDANHAEPIPERRQTAFLWVDRTAQISLDGQHITLESLSAALHDRFSDPSHPVKKISLKIDQQVEMRTVLSILRELRKTGGPASRIAYSTLTAKYEYPEK